MMQRVRMLEGEGVGQGVREEQQRMARRIEDASMPRFENVLRSRKKLMNAMSSKLLSLQSFISLLCNPQRKGGDTERITPLPHSPLELTRSSCTSSKRYASPQQRCATGQLLAHLRSYSRPTAAALAAFKAFLVS